MKIQFFLNLSFLKFLSVKGSRNVVLEPNCKPLSAICRVIFILEKKNDILC